MTPLAIAPLIRIESYHCYRLTLDLKIPPVTGALIMEGDHFRRAYPLPSAGEPRGFGMKPGNDRSLVLWTTNPVGAQVRLTLIGVNEPGVVGGYELREIEPRSLPGQGGRSAGPLSYGRGSGGRAPIQPSLCRHASSPGGVLGLILDRMPSRRVGPGLACIQGHPPVSLRPHGGQRRKWAYSGPSARSGMTRPVRSTADGSASSWYSASVFTFQRSKCPPWRFRTASRAVIIEWS